MNAIYPSGRSLGLPEDDMRFALRIARQGGGARFASRSSRYSSRDDEEEPREERPRRSGSSVGTSWLIAGFVLAVGVVIVLIVAHKAGTENLPSFQEFQDRISALMGGQRVFPVMPAAEFVSRVGLPIPGRDFDDPNFLYHYYRVKEGIVEIVLDKPSWKTHKARIVRITLQ